MAFLTKKKGHLFENILFFFLITFDDTEIIHFSFNEFHRANVISNNEPLKNQQKKSACNPSHSVLDGTVRQTSFFQ